MFISLVIILLAASCSARPRQFYDDGVSDAEYIRIASETEEARVFLDRFPETEVLMDRSSRLAVDYRFTRIQPATTEQSWEGIRLRVFIERENKRVESVFIHCTDQDGEPHFIDEGLIRYMEQYGNSQRCS